MEGRTIRIGVDVGGTNTDICAIDEKSGELMVYKLPSSLHDQSAAVVEGVKVIAEEYGFPAKMSAVLCMAPPLPPTQFWKPAELKPV